MRLQEEIKKLDMIYLLVGTDIEKRNKYINDLINKKEVIHLWPRDISLEQLFLFEGNNNLFGENPVIICHNIIEDGGVNLNKPNLEKLSGSDKIFIFIERSLSKTDEKVYLKYTTIEYFEDKKVQAKHIDNFAIASAFERRDKINTWIIYRDTISRGESPEAISGILFWKIKNMILVGTKHFTKEELKRQSSDLISLYHRAHLGEIDFVIGLEQFILNSLSK